MLDLHAHVLPAVDDGPPDLEAAIALASAAADAGTTTIAATSHVDHTFHADVASFAQRRAALQAALDERGVPVRIVQGGEVALDRLPTLTDDELRQVTLGDGPWILLEPPFSYAGREIGHAVHDLQQRGFSVLLAHPERSPDFLGRPDALLELIERGVRVQITGSSLSGGFGPPARAFSLDLLARRAVHVIASDAHGAQARRPDVGRHLESAASALPAVADRRAYWTVEAPEAILAGRPVPDAPAVGRARRSGLTNWLRRR